MAVSQKAVNLHKRLAMGDSVAGYKKGGTIASDQPIISVGSSGKAVNPLTLSKRQNGIPGFKSGGLVGEPSSGSDQSRKDFGGNKMMKKGGRC